MVEASSKHFSTISFILFLQFKWRRFLLNSHICSYLRLFPVLVFFWWFYFSLGEFSFNLYTCTFKYHTDLIYRICSCRCNKKKILTTQKQSPDTTNKGEEPKEEDNSEITSTYANVANGGFYQELCQLGEPSHYDVLKYNEWILVPLYLKCKYVQKRKRKKFLT